MRVGSLDQKINKDISKPHPQMKYFLLFVNNTYSETSMFRLDVGDIIWQKFCCKMEEGHDFSPF